MLPAKIKGLNRESSDESNDEEEENPVTKEALEQKTQQRYRDALILQKQNKLDEAASLLRNILSSEVLVNTDGKVKFVNGRPQSSLFHLKYCCYLNLGNILFKVKNYNSALDNYLKATELDDTDLNLWFKIGNVAMKIPNLSFAIHAYMEALRRNSSHWPSLDSIITATFATGDLMACLVFISRSLGLDSFYTKGLILKDLIFQEHPFLKTDFEIFHSDCSLKLNNTAYDENEKTEILAEIERLKIADSCLKNNPVKMEQDINEFEGWLKTLKSPTWLNLGKMLIKLYKSVYADPNDELFFSPIKLSGICQTSDQVTEQNSEILCGTVNETKMDVDDEIAKVSVATGDELSEDGDDVLTELVSVSNKPNEPEKENIDAGSKPKRRKCSPTLADQLKICDKRRSTRNKTVLKNNEPSLSKTLQQLISKDLLSQKDKLSKSNFYDLLRWNEDSFDTMDIYRLLFEHQEQNLPSYPVNQLTETTRHKLIHEENYFGTNRENKDIDWFVQINNDQTILEILAAYLRDLAGKWCYTWPMKLADIFVEIFQILLKHGFEGCRLSIDDICHSDDSTLDDDSLKALEDKINVILLYGELLLNQYLESEIKEQPLGNSALGGNFSSLLIGDLHDACSLVSVTERKIKFLLRTYWLETLIFVQKKDTFAACSALSTLIEEILDPSIEIRLPNMKQFYVISLSGAKRLLNTLCRNQNLSEVKPLLLEKQYDRVIEILRETLKPDSSQLMHLPNETTLSRYQQYNLLLEALWQSQNYEELFEWCEVCCYEAFAVYRKSFFDEIESDAKSKWASLVTNTVNGMFSCFKTDGLSIAQSLKPEQLSRLVQTLSNLVCHQVEASEPCPEIVADVITPWILLACLIEFNEKHNTSEVMTDTLGEPVLSSAISLMFIAHEHLGRRSWCCFSDGALLFYTLNLIEPLYQSCMTSSELRITLGQQVDQIFFCLYSHPFKKNKARHVVEHNSFGLALTWNRAVHAYSFYRPSVLPIFDAASKNCSISADTETLLKRMVSLIPEDQHPVRFIDSIHGYLNGTVSEIPVNENRLPPEVIDVFYLLGDYYFKNKIMGKAIKYYLLDICLNSRRIDSWSAMALARGSQLEMKLNSCETITSECDILKKAELTDKCYKTALELDLSQSSLWIEYGVFAYTIHAFCSRLLKQETTNLSLQMFEMLENRKDGFLKTSNYCFDAANDTWLELTSKQEDVSDERWLHHYILGKIGEKREEKIDVCLNHYYEASKLLHQYGAEYPARILYSSPQYYSVEALEIYYRVHASILKILETHEEKALDNATVNNLKMYIDKMVESPFMNARVKPTSNKANDKSVKEEAFSKNVLIVQECEVQEIVEEIITTVVYQTNEVSALKRRISDSSPTDDSVVKKIKLSSEDAMVIEENEQSDKSDECRLTAASADEEEFRSKKKRKTSGTDLSSSDSPSHETSSDSSSSDSSSVSSDSEDDTDKEDENKSLKECNDFESSQNWQKTRKQLIDACINALEECIRRFPEHYKSFYRLSHHYFRSKLDKNIEKARNLLIEEGGLFADRTNKNFFGGIWRIPTGEIDRPGSFAFHMSRSIHLLMDVLRDTLDYKTLLQLSNQLRFKPDLDKKYLRDNEREQLCKDALSLSISALRKHIDHMSVMEKEPIKRKLLLDVYKYYLRVSKNYSQKDTSFIKLLGAVYYKYTKRKIKASMEEIISFCKTVDQISKSEEPQRAVQLLEVVIGAENGKLVLPPMPQLTSESKPQPSTVPVVAEAKTQPQQQQQQQQPQQQQPPPVNKPKTTSSASSCSSSIPSNLKNLPAAITVTTVPPKPRTFGPVSASEKNAGAAQLVVSAGNSVVQKSRNCVVIRTQHQQQHSSAHKEKMKTSSSASAGAAAKSDQPPKMKQRVSLSSSADDKNTPPFVKLSLLEHPTKSTTKFKTLVDNTIEQAIGGAADKSLTILPVKTDEKNVSSGTPTVTNVASSISSSSSVGGGGNTSNNSNNNSVSKGASSIGANVASSTKVSTPTSSPTTTSNKMSSPVVNKPPPPPPPSTKGLPPELTTVSKERPSLIITPVSMSTKAPTLQQKLAAKQMAAVSSNVRAHLSSTSGGSGGGAGSTSSNVNSNNISSSGGGTDGVMKSHLEVSKQLGSSGVSIFPLPVADSSTNNNNNNNNNVVVSTSSSSSPSLPLSRLVGRETEILSLFQSNSSYSKLISPIPSKGGVTTTRIPSSSSSPSSCSSPSSTASSSTTSPLPSPSAASHVTLVKSKVTKKTDQKLQQKQQSPIDFNNLKTCHQGLIIEQASKNKSTLEAKSRFVSKGSEETSVVTITSKPTPPPPPPPPPLPKKSSSSHIEVITLQ